MRDNAPRCAPPNTTVATRIALSANPASAGARAILRASVQRRSTVGLPIYRRDRDDADVTWQRGTWRYITDAVRMLAHELHHGGVVVERRRGDGPSREDHLLPIALHGLRVAVQDTGCEAPPQLGGLALVNGLRLLTVAPRRALLEEETRERVGPDDDERVERVHDHHELFFLGMEGGRHGPRYQRQGDQRPLHTVSISTLAVTAAATAAIGSGMAGVGNVTSPNSRFMSRIRTNFLSSSLPSPTRYSTLTRLPNAGGGSMASGARSITWFTASASTPITRSMPSTWASTITMQVRFVIAVGARLNCSARSTT